jgi:photosystem II stability/assembly factor-like uncharacterized protein
MISDLTGQSTVRRCRTVAACIAAAAWFATAMPAVCDGIKLSDTVMTVPAIMVRAPQHSLFNSIAVAGAVTGALAGALASERLVAVGEHGRIVLSDDDGRSWRQVATPTSVTLTAVRFASPTEGWAVGQMGVVLHTQDAGATWQMQFDGVTANAEMLRQAQHDLSLPGADKATAQANLQAAQQFTAGGPDNPFLGVLPVSATSVIVTGAFGMVFTSTDGGQSFQSSFDAVPNPNGLHIYAVLGDGDHQILAGEQGLLLRRSADGRFSALSAPAQGSLFGGLKTSSGALVLFGIQGEIIRSVDDGRTWTTVAVPVAAGIDCGIQLRDGRIMLGDEAGNVLISKDDGATFTVIALGQPVIALQQAPDGAVIRAALRGIDRLPLATFTSSS